MLSSRIPIALLAACFLAAPSFAQPSEGLPFQEAEIGIAYDKGDSGDATVTLTPKGKVGTTEISLTMSDDRQDYELRLRSDGDGPFSARAELPPIEEIRSIRIATDGGGAKSEILMPESLSEDAEGNFVGKREANGWYIEIVARRGDDIIIVIIIRGT